jgi:glutathione S-transferase
LYESLIICEYLDSIYPEHRLTPTDPFVKAKHQILIEVFSNNVTSAFYKIMRNEENANDEVNSSLEYFEKNLDGNFFGGEKEAMVDYMIWPWYMSSLICS